MDLIGVVWNRYPIDVPFNSFRAMRPRWAAAELIGRGAGPVGVGESGGVIISSIVARGPTSRRSSETRRTGVGGTMGVITW